MEIITTYPLWYLLLCVLAGIGAAALLYFRDRNLKDFHPAIIKILAGLRFVVVTILAFFLLEPMLKMMSQDVEAPVVVVALDNSASMVLSADSSNVRMLAAEGLPELASRLGQKFEVRTYGFGDKIQENPTFDFKDRETDIAGFLNEIYQRYSNRNLGAVILASDGLYNRGMNPIHRSHLLGAPIYTIALGDTTARKDVLIRDLSHNQLAYLGNDFPVEMIVEARGYDGEATEVSILKNGQELARQQVRFQGEVSQQAVKFLLPAEPVGIQRFTASVKPLSGEFTTLNNTREFYLEILDSKQKILVVANAPHPDIRAIRLALETHENYEVEVILAGEVMPVLEEYNLVVLHGLPSRQFPIGTYLNAIRDKNIPTWFILTGQSDLQAFNNFNAGVRISNPRATSNAVGSAFNSTFSLFSIEAETGHHFGKLPPLSAPFGDYQLTTQAQVLMYQRVGAVKTEYPLFAFTEVNDQKAAVLVGEGLWRWRTMSYADFRSHDVFNSLVQKTAQYLSARESKAFLRISGARTFRENEPVVFRAESYNKSYELVTDPEVIMEITDEEGRTYEFSFSRAGNAYRLQAGLLPAGNYRYIATSITTAERHTAEGAFSVVPVNVEAMQTRANHQLLYQLSQTTSGAMLYPDNLQQLPEMLAESGEIASVIYDRKELADLINLRWIFFCLLALLAIEWFIRKRGGAY
ncbi:MAG: VWA domain-containing protein [Cryomorphaceae bacterium]|nr:MAG: VWA domain-containing protein [Cryomorphaceae bacterium]